MGNHQHTTTACDYAVDNLGGDDGLAGPGRGHDQRPGCGSEKSLNASDDPGLIGSKGGHGRAFLAFEREGGRPPQLWRSLEFRSKLWLRRRRGADTCPTVSFLKFARSFP